ncbi:MAG: hypothetical protein JXK04_07395 [Campylobacterales bacterium]|nr:hypothetical protein [Campylobacterales bacterium]
MKEIRTDHPTLENAAVDVLSRNGHKRTFSFVYEDEKYWIKQPEYGEANLWHSLMSLLSKFLNNNFFRPTVVTDPIASLAYEAKRLNELKAAGINVPRVRVQKQGYLVLEDAGVPMSVLLGSSAMKEEEKKSLASELSRALADLHNRGFYHSRPALRDIAYKEGKIYFMDFEENLENTLTPEEAIIRDGFLYVHTLYRKLRTPELVETALDAYHRTLRPDLWDNLVSEARRYSLTYRVLKPIYRHLGKDGVAIYQTLEYLRRF